MSQIVSEIAEPADRRRQETLADGEFDYQPVPPLAPISLFLGICSFAGLMGIPGLAIGIVGLSISLVALWQIARSEGQMGGRLVARLGLGFSSLFLVAGASLHAHEYATEVPEGYKRVSFNWLSQQAPTIKDGIPEVAPEVAALDGQPIFVKGYMYPTRQKTAITEFVLVKDTGQCCFGGNPKLTDMIVVKLRNGKTVEHRELSLVKVAGTFHAGAVTRSGELTAIYTIDGTHFQ